VVRRALARIGFALAAWLGATSRAGHIGPRGAAGFVASPAAGGPTLVVFRGTRVDTLEDLIADSQAVPAAWRPGVRVHAGFRRAFQSVSEPLRAALADIPDPPVITGHSLGGALATLAAAEHRKRAPTLVTFGSPRVGDEAFQRLFDGLAVRRIVHCCDVVPRLPPDRIDAAPLGELIAHLTGSAARARLAARGLADALRVAGIQPTFRHVGEGRYADRHGVLRAAIAEEDRARDQGGARREYAARRGRPGGSAGLPAFRAAITLEATRGSVRAVLRALLRMAWEAVTPERVPLRDLADHAPINYVSIFTGRE
jgi:pimeloyl-ACP methyl ester carboxylesterase